MTHPLAPFVEADWIRVHNATPNTPITTQCTRCQVFDTAPADVMSLPAFIAWLKSIEATHQDCKPR